MTFGSVAVSLATRMILSVDVSKPMVIDSEVDTSESLPMDGSRRDSVGRKGSASEIERITLGYLYRHALEICNLERGLGFTVFRWVAQPRRAAQEFLFEDRGRYVKPFTTLALAVTLITFVSFQLFDLNAQMATANSQLAQLPEHFRPALQLALSYVVQFIHVFLVISLPFQAWRNSLLFRHVKWFFPEHMVAVTYLYAIQMLINTCLLPLMMVHEIFFGLISSIAAPAYVFWAIFQIYGAQWWRTILAWGGYLLIGSIMPAVLASILFGVIYLTGFAN